MDTNKPFSSIDDLMPGMLLHQAHRDEAVLGRPGDKTLSLWNYYRKRQAGAINQLAQAAFLKALLDECRAEAGRLIEGADTPEKRRNILLQVQHLNVLAEQAAARLDTMGPAAHNKPAVDSAGK